MPDVDLNSSLESSSSMDHSADDLHSKLKSIVDTVKILKNFKPEEVKLPIKKLRGRPPATSKTGGCNSGPTTANPPSDKPEPSGSSIPCPNLTSISEILQRICEFNLQILKKLDCLQEENQELKIKLANQSSIPVATSPHSTQSSASSRFEAPTS